MPRSIAAIDADIDRNSDDFNRYAGLGILAFHTTRLCDEMDALWRERTEAEQEQAQTLAHARAMAIGTSSRTAEQAACSNPDHLPF